MTAGLLEAILVLQYVLLSGLVGNHAGLFVNPIWGFQTVREVTVTLLDIGQKMMMRRTHFCFLPWQNWVSCAEFQRWRWNHQRITFLEPPRMETWVFQRFCSISTKTPHALHWTNLAPSQWEGEPQLLYTVNQSSWLFNPPCSMHLARNCLVWPWWGLVKILCNMIFLSIGEELVEQPWYLGMAKSSSPASEIRSLWVYQIWWMWGAYPFTQNVQLLIYQSSLEALESSPY